MMTIHAFKDAADGYYQCDVADGEPLPSWTIGLTPCAVIPPEPPQQPSPLEQIRALEAQYADAQAKLTRQSLLALALDKACADPLAENLTREQVHAFLLAGDNGYAALWNLEQQVEALRAQV